MDLLLSIDFLGSDYSLTYKQKSRSRTVIGAFLSLVVIGMFFVAFYFFGKEIFLRQEPIMRANQIFSRDNKLSLSDVPIMFTVLSNSAVPVPAKEMVKYARFQGALVTLGYNSENEFKISYALIPVEPCSTGNTSPEFFELLSKTNDPQFFLCLNQSKMRDIQGNSLNSEAFMRNPFGYVDSAHISIGMHKCSEKQNPGCSLWLDQNQRFYVTRYYLTHYFDFTNYSTPTTRFDKNFTNRVDVNLITKNYTRFTINELVTDSGAIFKDESTEFFFTTEKEYQFLSLRTESDRELVTFYHEVSFIKNHFHRRYVTVQEVFANIGGFIKGLMVCVSVFVKFYSRFVFFNSFREELLAKKGEVSRQEVSVIRNLESSSQNIKAKEKKETSVSFWKYLVAFVSSKKQREYKLNYNEVMKYVDLSYLTEKLIVLEHRMNETGESNISLFNRRN